MKKYLLGLIISFLFIPLSSFAWDTTGIISSVTFSTGAGGTQNRLTVTSTGGSNTWLSFYGLNNGLQYGEIAVWQNSNSCEITNGSAGYPLCGYNGANLFPNPSGANTEYIVYARNNANCNGLTSSQCSAVASGSFKIRTINNAFTYSNWTEQSLFVYGCSNPVATNYNVNVTNDDGSCVFNSNPNGTSSPVGTNGQLGIHTDFNGKNYWYRISSSRFYQAVPWVSKNYVYVFIEGTTNYLYNQVYVYGTSTQPNIVTDSFSHPEIVRSFIVDGRTISIYRLYTKPNISLPTFELNLFGTTGNATSSTRIYGVIPSNSYTAPTPTDQATMYSFLSSYTDNTNAIWYSPISTYNYAPVQTTNYPRTLTFPAQLYSLGSLIQNPVITSSYSFSAPPVQSLNGVQQGGVIFISHDPTITPVITWGTKVMTLIETSTGTVDGYKISVYHVKNPVPSSTIYLTSIAVNKIRYVQASIWNFGEKVNTYDKYTVNTTSNRAWIDLTNLINPYTTVASILTTNINGYDKLADTVVRRSYSNSAGTSSYALFSRVCTGNTIDSCPVGYTNQWNLGSVSGEVIGVSMYSTLAGTSTVITAINLDDPAFKRLIPNESRVNFSDCFTEMNNYGLLDVGFYKAMSGASVCVLKNTALWVFQLFVPTSDQIANLSTDLVAKMQEGKMFSTALGMPFYIFSLVSTSTPITEVSYYNITVPSSISNGTFSTSSFPIKVKVGVMSSITDQRISNFIAPFFAVFGIFLGGFLLLKLLH